jgi:hypothetical protein
MSMSKSLSFWVLAWSSQGIIFHSGLLKTDFFLDLIAKTV